jgi:hypothetical protein
MKLGRALLSAKSQRFAPHMAETNFRFRPGAEVQSLEMNAAELPLVLGRKADMPDLQFCNVNANTRPTTDFGAQANTGLLLS